VVNRYNQFFGLGLTDQQEHDPEYVEVAIASSSRRG
jgi:hypothetical protein